MKEKNENPLEEACSKHQEKIAGRPNYRHIRCACGRYFWAHSRARNRVCCACRTLRAQKPRLIPTPDTQVFHSLDEARAYLNVEKPRCLICGAEKAGLYAHVRTAHHISPDDYKIMFGIPLSWGLTGTSTKEKFRRCAAATQEQLRDAGYPNLAKARAAKPQTRRQQPSYVRRDWGAKMAALPNHLSNLEGEEDAYCSHCGAPMKVHPLWALRTCSLLCGNCRAAEAA